MNRIILGLILMAVCIMPSMSQELHFTFTCEGKNSTMSSYAYVKEPSLSESGYTRGLKTGSFNYLDGGMIDLSEGINYQYGNGTYVGNNSSDRSVTHTLEVDFDGRRGISEFYGKGFFNYNRVVSAWKKIRYEDLSRYENATLEHGPNRNGFTVSTLGIPRTARNFSVDASVEMYTNFDTESYNFKYEASAKDAVIETKDAAGWSNRTGARRIDFEHDSLISGEELNITNVLEDSHPWTTEAGGDGWLSCCIGGTSEPYQPEIERWSGCEDGSCEPEGEWPGNGEFATLEPAKLLPNVNRNQEHMIDPAGGLRSADPTYTDFNCSDANCSGFECIYQVGGGEGERLVTSAGGAASEFANLSRIAVSYNYPDVVNLTTETIMNYTISVRNSGETQLKNVTLYDTLPLNADYISSSFYKGGELKPIDYNDTKPGNETLYRVTLSLGIFQSGEEKQVYILASHKGGTKDPNYYRSNKVYVTGDTPDKGQVNKTATPPDAPRRRSII